MNQKIAVIDSGLGGLTVAKRIIEKLPNEEIVYFGDTARCPYGNKEKEEIKEYVWEMVHFLSKYPLKALVVACNTATALLIDELTEKIDVPVIGVIKPGALSACEKSINRKIGVIGTTRTIESGAYAREIEKRNNEVEVFSLATPEFVPMIEKGQFHTEKAKDIVRASLYPLLKNGIDTLVMGCTHYPLMRGLISEIVNEKIHLIDPAEKTIELLKEVIKENENRIEGNLFFVSGEIESFKKHAEAWMEENINIRRVFF